MDYSLKLKSYVALKCLFSFSGQKKVVPYCDRFNGLMHLKLSDTSINMQIYITVIYQYFHLLDLSIFQTNLTDISYVQINSKICSKALFNWEIFY